MGTPMALSSMASNESLSWLNHPYPTTCVEPENKPKNKPASYRDVAASGVPNSEGNDTREEAGEKTSKTPPKTRLRRSCCGAGYVYIDYDGMIEFHYDGDEIVRTQKKR